MIFCSFSILRAYLFNCLFLVTRPGLVRWLLILGRASKKLQSSLRIYKFWPTEKYDYIIETCLKRLKFMEYNQDFWLCNLFQNCFGNLLSFISSAGEVKTRGGRGVIYDPLRNRGGSKLKCYVSLCRGGVNFWKAPQLIY